MRLEKIQITKVEIDKTTIYFFAVNEIIGKCGLKIRENNLLRCMDSEINKEYHGIGIYSRMNSYRQKFLDIKFKGWKVESYCKESTKSKFQKEGYEVKDVLYLMEKTL